MNHKGCGKSSACGLDCFAWRQVAVADDDFAALFKDCGTTGAMDRSIDSASAHQAGICGVDDSVGGLLRDVASLKEDQRIFSQVQPNDVFHDLLVSQRFHAGKFLAFQKFKRRSATGRNMRDLIGYTSVMDCRYAVSASHD